MDEDSNQHFVIEADELADGERVIADIEGREICIFNSDGEYHALANYCIHQGGPLCEGTLGGYLTLHDGELSYRDGNKVICCPWHGWEFNVESGAHVSRPEYNIPSYKVVESGGKLYVVVN